MASHHSGAHRSGAPRAGAPRAGAPRASNPHFEAPHIEDPFSAVHQLGLYGGAPHFGDHHPAVHEFEPYGDVPPHHMVSVRELSGRTAPDDVQQKLNKKFNTVAFGLGLIEILGLIIALSLWQTGNKAAGIVVLCVGYLSTYFLLALSNFLETAEYADLTLRYRLLRLEYKYLILKLFLVVQLGCIYLQRSIVPDLWPFALSLSMFLVMTPVFVKACHEHYKIDATKKWYLLTLSLLSVGVAVTQIGYFIPFAIAYGKTTPVELILEIGSLFVAIFLGQIANIVMIAMTNISELGHSDPAVSGTEV